MTQFSLSKAFQQPLVTYICKTSCSQSISPWKRTEEPTMCDEHQFHHLTQSQIACSYCEELLHMNISRAEQEHV